MKILHYFKSNIMSGAERVVYDISSQLNDHPEFEVIVLCGGEPVRSYFDKLGIQTAVFTGKNILKLRSIIRSIKPDLIHAHDNRASFMALAAAGKIPVIFHVHNFYPYYERRNMWYWVNRVLRKSFSLTLYCSDHLLERVKENAPELVDHRSASLNNPIDVTRIVSQVSQDEKSNSKKTIGFIGRMTEQKGLVPFLNSVSKHRKSLDDQNLKIQLVGGGVQNQLVLDLLKSLKLDDIVEKVDHIENPYPTIAAFDLLILPSLWEGLPITMLEAAVLKTPVFATDVGGVKQFITHGETGYLSTPGDPDCFVKTMLNLLPADHTAVTEKAYEKAITSYDIKPYIKNLTVHYQDLINHK